MHRPVPFERLCGRELRCFASRCPERSSGPFECYLSAVLQRRTICRCSLKTPPTILNFDGELQYRSRGRESPPRSRDPLREARCGGTWRTGWDSSAAAGTIATAASPTATLRMSARRLSPPPQGLVTRRDGPRRKKKARSRRVKTTVIPRSGTSPTRRGRTIHRFPPLPTR